MASLKCVDKTIKVNPKIFEFSKFEPNIEEEIDLTTNNIFSEDFQEIEKFYEAYNFDKKEFEDPSSYKKKIKSSSIVENIGEKNYKIISNLLFGSKNMKLDRVKRIFDIIIRYGFEEYKFILLSAMGSKFYLKEFQEDTMDFYLGQFGINYNYDDRNLIDFLNMIRE